MCKSKASRTKINFDDGTPRATHDCKVCNRRRIKYVTDSFETIHSNEYIIGVIELYRHVRSVEGGN